MPKKKPSRGGWQRQKAKGLECVVVWMTAEEKELLQEAAPKDNRNLTQFVVSHSVNAAKKILADSA